MVVVRDPKTKIGVKADKKVIQLGLIYRDPRTKRGAAGERVKWPEHIEQTAIRLRDKLMEKGVIGK